MNAAARKSRAPGVNNTEMRDLNEKLVIAAVRQQELAEAALQSGALLRLLVGNFPDGMVLLFDRDLRHVLADGRGLEALGLSRAALEGRTPTDAFDAQACRQIEPAYRAALAGEATLLEVGFPAGRLLQVHALPVRDDRGALVAGMAVAQDVTERRRAEETIRWQAHHDALTGLPNRALLRDRLDQVLTMSDRAGEAAGLLFLDLDGFKRVNDTLGHAAGDRLLQTVAARLTGCLRAEDTVARMGGDEFVVLLPRLHAAGDAAQVARKIGAALAPPIRVGRHTLTVTASVGVSVYPLDGQDADALLRHADAAMYRAKEGRRAGPPAPPEAAPPAAGSRGRGRGKAAFSCPPVAGC